MPKATRKKIISSSRSPARPSSWSQGNKCDVNRCFTESAASQSARFQQKHSLRIQNLQNQEKFSLYNYILLLLLNYKYKHQSRIRVETFFGNLRMHNKNGKHK